jgi:hypothetical protein
LVCTGSINDKYVNLLYERAKEVKNFQSVPYNLDNGSNPAVQQYVSSLARQERYNEVRTPLLVQGEGHNTEHVTWRQIGRTLFVVTSDPTKPLG